MKERNWINLISSIKHKQCVLVLGPDLINDFNATSVSESELSDTPSTREEPSVALSSHLSSDLEEEEIKIVNSALISITQQYEDAPDLGPSTLRSRVSSFYQKNVIEPGEVHRLLADLPFNLIITTRHDQIMETALTQANKKPINAHYNMRGSQRDNPELNIDYTDNNPLLFRLFGDVQKPESLVLSENDILDFVIAISSARPSLPTSLISTLKSPGKTFLFVGFGIKDWYLRVLLKILMRVLQINQSGFAVASESLMGISDADKESTVLFFRRGKRVEIEDGHTQAFLSELSERLASETIDSDERTPVGPMIRVFISYAREDLNLARELQQGLDAAGFEVWMDVDALEGGEDWDATIKNELQSTDFVLIVYSDALYRKTDSYVNKEIHLAVERSMRIRGQYIIPLRTNDLPSGNVIDELAALHEMSLDETSLQNDIDKVVSAMRRSFQRRKR